jgi:ribosome maturation factor RimP
METSLEEELEAFLPRIGFELVALERGGGRRRPLLRLRMDRPEGRPGHSTITVDDCAAVSRAVTKVLEERGKGEEEWILEVSSPGVDRPLTKARDYRRFAGETVRLRGYGPIRGTSRQVVGVLVGVESGIGGDETVIVEVEGERVSVPLSGISRATLTFEPADES